MEHFEEHAKAGGFLAAAVSQAGSNGLIFLGGHGFQHSDLLDHHFLDEVNAAEKSDHPIGIFLLQVIVDVQQGVGDQLHPQFFHLMDDLELQFIGVA